MAAPPLVCSRTSSSAQAPFDAAPAQLLQLASAEARILNLSEADAEAAALVAARVLRHDLLTRARIADGRGACRRETPVTITLADGTLVEGVVDLAWEEDGQWIVADYKTDRELAVEERYRHQVALYAAAIAEATGAAAVPMLLRI